jgi:uncharacterized membrane protein
LIHGAGLSCPYCAEFFNLFCWLIWVVYAVLGLLVLALPCGLPYWYTVAQLVFSGKYAGIISGILLVMRLCADFFF